AELLVTEMAAKRPRSHQQQQTASHNARCPRSDARVFYLQSDIDPVDVMLNSRSLVTFVAKRTETIAPFNDPDSTTLSGDGTAPTRFFVMATASSPRDASSSLQSF